MSEKRYWDESIETLPRAKLADYQTDQLRKHLEVAWDKSPYYRQSSNRPVSAPLVLAGWKTCGAFPSPTRPSSATGRWRGLFWGT